MVAQGEDKEPAWAKGLLPEQRVAASHLGSNARLLAGPGTGKTYTLTARAAFLVMDQNVEPKAVVALTFTRAAAGELRARVEKALEGQVAGRPRIMTLHAFALRTLMKNAELLDALPRPLRIADDWEERNIIQEDLKEITASNVKDVRKNLQAMSADWDTLRADEEAENPLKADARFVGAWQQHRRTYGYTLRSELVYQLKRALEQRDDLDVGGAIQHLLVDEYQDLNACDLSAIACIAGKGRTSLYSAGDDDQSIYGFRHANPEGIRRFDREHAPSTDLPLATCMRCDQAIMGLSRFVANLDPNRLEKPWNARGSAGTGEVKLIRFGSGEEEAEGIASLCKYLITEKKYRADDILILIRSDRNGAFSKPLAEQMTLADVPLSLNIDSGSPLDSESGRVALSMIRLAADANDSLAWRTLLDVRANGIGEKAIDAIVAEAKTGNTTFAQALLKRAAFDGALKREFTTLEAILVRVKAVVGDAKAVLAPEQLSESLAAIAKILEDAGVTGLDEANAHILSVAQIGDTDSFDTLLSSLSLASFTDQERAEGAVNMLTMHKAKGLSARAVIVMACEDEYVPGRQQGADEEADERRLLYVSLTRAKQSLFITYAQKRTGPQQHTGRDSGKARRTLTRYLRNAPIHPIPAADFFNALSA